MEGELDLWGCLLANERRREESRGVCVLLLRETSMANVIVSEEKC